MQAARTPAVDIRAALGAFVVSIVVFMVGVACMGAVQDAHACERADGYNPAGMTRDERYSPDTWAGLCVKNESASVAAYDILIVGGLAGMAVAVVATVQSG